MLQVHRCRLVALLLPLMALGASAAIRLDSLAQIEAGAHGTHGVSTNLATIERPGEKRVPLDLFM